MIVLVIAWNNLRRLLRERSNLFFVFVLPLMLILVLGVTVGGDTPRIGVYLEGGPTPPAQELIDGIERLDDVTVESFADLETATGELEREDITALVVVPVDYDDALASESVAEIEYRVIPTSGGFEMQSLVESVVADQNGAIRAGRVIAEQTGLPPTEASA
ncbi:MAG: ABC transporter permease, partial [Actinomycetota bacterium]